jgi:hypothetical protein
VVTYTNFNWITERLAVGGMLEEPDPDLPFEAILSLETHAPATVGAVARNENVTYEWHSIIDGYSHEPDEEIVRRFTQAADRIAALLGEGKRVLVHCTAGVSRSATAVTWYLMRSERLSWDEAVERVRRARPVVFPNVRFEIPLRMAAGEPVTDQLVRERVQAFVDFYPEWAIEQARIVEELALQGTYPRPTTPVE